MNSIRRNISAQMNFISVVYLKRETRLKMRFFLNFKTIVYLDIVF